MADQVRTPRNIIEIAYSGPAKMSDGRWRLNVWATVKQRIGNQPAVPLDNQKVIFFVNGKEEEKKKDTSGNGRTGSLPLSFPADTRNAVIEAQISGETTGDRIEVEFVSVQKKSADKWEVKAYGANGQYVVRVYITSQDRLPLQGVMIHVIDDKKAEQEPIVKDQTDQDGHISLVIPSFSERYRNFSVIAVGTQLDHVPLHLDGPLSPRLRKPPTPPEFPVEYEGWFSVKKTWGAIREVIRRGREDKKRNQQTRRD